MRTMSLRMKAASQHPLALNFTVAVHDSANSRSSSRSERFHTFTRRFAQVRVSSYWVKTRATIGRLSAIGVLAGYCG